MPKLGRPGWLASFVLVLFTLLTSRAQAAYVPPPIAGHVTDAAGKLTAEERSALERKLADYRRCSGNHVAVFYPRTLEGYSVEDAAFATFNTWRIGEAKKDNGVLLLLATGERKVRIETGKGVGGQLPDLAAGQILRETVVPNMKADHLFAAADEATTRIASALGGCMVADIGSAVPSAHVRSGPTNDLRPSEDMALSWMMSGVVFALVMGAALSRRTSNATAVVVALVIAINVRIVLSVFPKTAHGYDVSLACALFGFVAVLAGAVNAMGWWDRWVPAKPGLSPRRARRRSTSAGGVAGASDWSDYAISSTTTTTSSLTSAWSSSGSDFSGGGSSYDGGGGFSGGGGSSDSY